ncbi:hypothetical protein GOP47_0016371 [Adiantum capillus-veneris]|uniref:Shugoshin C-terminal domain-containing protein n=1 Tax=Adiantum capillus-veneris TaxID=13818 RepID=A0A9D4UIL2_ADICA|nr:hypothetical protein GOP47_0016371 [Adiantum capillus-veneris]
MGNENIGRKTSKAVGHRKKLSDLSNTPILLKSRIHDENAQLAQKGTLAQLQEELANVNQMLAEKEEILAESKRCMEKLWCNYCRKSKQNDEIILHNSQLYRDLTQAQDQLKVLQHENAQMSAVYKACKLEMQEKLNDALEQANRLRKLVEASSLKQASDKKCPPSTESGRALCCEIPAENSDGIHSKSVLRKRERRSYKEPSLKAKSQLKQREGNWSPLQRWPVENEPHRTASQQCTEKCEDVSKHDILPTSTRESFDRPQRRAASSVGSYKEPSLNTKMRRAK